MNNTQIKSCNQCGYIFGKGDEKYRIGFGKHRKKIVCGDCRDKKYGNQ